MRSGLPNDSACSISVLSMTSALVMPNILLVCGVATEDEIVQQGEAFVRGFLWDHMATIRENMYFRIVQMIDQFHAGFLRRHTVPAGENHLYRAGDSGRRMLAILIAITGSEIARQFAGCVTTHDFQSACDH